MSLLSVGDSKNQCVVSTSRGVFDSIKSEIADVHRARTLCSYLREALKQKEMLINKVNRWELESFAESIGEEYPTQPIKTSDVFVSHLENELPIEKLLRYLSLQSAVSTLGDLIHDGGDVAIARDNYQTAMSKPTVVEGNGRDTIVIYHTPSKNYTEQEIEDLFFSLQQIHRSHQKELNSIKYELEDKYRRLNIERDEKYHDEQKIYNNKLQTLMGKFTTAKEIERNRISNLKIIIPNELKDIYDFI